MTANRPASARLSAVATAGRLPATYTTSGDTTQATQAYSTLELKIAHHRAMTAQTGVVRADGTVLWLGRRVALSEARLTDASRRLYASATSTLLIMDR